jgi:hypothetical protein
MLQKARTTTSGLQRERLVHRGQHARGIDAGLLSQLLLRRNVLVRRLAPPRIALSPANGASPRRTSNTGRVPPDTVRIASTVRAHAGNRDGSSSTGAPASLVLDATTLLYDRGYTGAPRGSPIPVT